MKDDSTLTVGEAAALLSIGEDLAYRLIRERGLPVIRFGAQDRVLRVLRSELEDWIAKESGQPIPPSPAPQPSAKVVSLASARLRRNAGQA